MGNYVEKSTLQAMILEILSKDQELLKDILQVIIKDYPQLVEEITTTSMPLLVNEPAVLYKKEEKSPQSSENQEITDEELDYWVEKHFEEYDAVFKALA